MLNQLRSQYNELPGIEKRVFSLFEDIDGLEHNYFFNDDTLEYEYN